MSINNCSVGPKIRTTKIYEQTYKYTNIPANMPSIKIT